MYLDNLSNFNRDYIKDRYKNEKEAIKLLLNELSWNKEFSNKIIDSSHILAEIIRNTNSNGADIDSFLQSFSLDTKEGIALMCIAESLLRIPDNKTADDLIADKILSADWLDSDKDSLLTKIAGKGLGLTKKALSGFMSGLGKPIIRSSMRSSMQYMGKQFILAENIEKAVKNAVKYQNKNYKISYDMLGEAARTSDDALIYFEAYRNSIEYLGSNNSDGKACVSVKLSALHPRYEASHYDECIPILKDRLMDLCRVAADGNVSLTIDAEESYRLDMSIEILAYVSADSGLSKWDGLGLALQAYDKRAYRLIDTLSDMAQSHDRNLQIRLVKGAYWDWEIKNSQINSHTNYSVFTRKPYSDLSYLACARKLLNMRKIIYPMFATHNVHSVCSILEMDRDISGGLSGGYEFQRLFGMGEKLYDYILGQNLAPVSIYAPIGGNESLLAYLVRRLLENGANSSFVNKINNKKISVRDLIKCPIEFTKDNKSEPHPNICHPINIYNNRINSSSLDLTDFSVIKNITEYVNNSLSDDKLEACSIINGENINDGIIINVTNPSDYSDLIGPMFIASDINIREAVDICNDGFNKWNKTNITIKADIFRKFADLLEENRDKFISLCVREAGKTIDDAVDEIREAVDFARYYSSQALNDFNSKGTVLACPTGESNILTYEGRGVFVCISPWNFPLAIFSGQVIAALISGNCVVAKPAEQTPIIAYEIVQLMLEAGVPVSALSLIIGDGEVGAKLVDNQNISGVAFTGSTEIARKININLASKAGAITPLIAETGGINVMIADSSSLPEQLVDDVIKSAFGSAGQKCSALRLLCIQDDVADKVIDMLSGAMKELKVGNPALISSDCGPLIDDVALSQLVRHKSRISGFGKILSEVPIPENKYNNGCYFMPVMAEIYTIDAMQTEIFGPFLHVLRYKNSERNSLIEKINNLGFGLTFGVHSRIEKYLDEYSDSIRCGNVYCNRNITGAIVESQPFGGMAMSGTGPKAGGPNYLKAFAIEKVITKNLTTSGGNYHLLGLKE